MNRPRWSVVLLMGACLIACEKGGEEKSDPPGQEGAKEESRSDKETDKSDSGGKALQIFDKALTKKACDILTPAMVSKMFQVPEPELKQMKMLGCIYSHRDKEAGQIVEARVTTIMAHKSGERAEQWFANATKSLTEEEAKKQVAMVAKKTKEHKDIDTKMEKKTVDTLGGALAKHAEGGIKYEKLTGIGDEAALNLSDGGIWVRVGNLTFVVAGYQGPEQPPADLKGLSIKEMTAAAVEAQKKWTVETMSQRKKAGSEVARAFVAALPN